MVQITIEDISGLIKGLIYAPFFDGLEMVRLELTTAVARTVDGRIRRDFYDDASEVKGDYIRWSEEKGNFVRAIRGSILPLSFRIIFRCPEDFAKTLIKDAAAEVSLFLNVVYERKGCYVTTGTAQNIFPKDRDSEELWDHFVQNAIQKLEKR